VVADLAISKTDSPDPVASGGTLTYTLTVTNLGPSPAAVVLVNDPLPTGTTFVSCVASFPGICSGPPVGMGGTVTASFGSIGSAGFATVVIMVNVTAPSGQTLTNTAGVTSSTPDPSPANNTDTEMTDVSP
jgi:uncharacterized repeat protein (TIGR01451 family)